ncbi:MAG: UDP-3-O-(3-hydroxymyristoyl)glucosamine N-acyltransferase [Desulfobacterium sp.]|jgi:UDP-3-O-[3-hydroxymyristoyl] glucosamine N-acyltransferase|nr:UDP-3-O-(3-hydroxymyristoyl)glucosamine N-acyltransferase [Desulfobacterium sp.]
MTSTLNINRNTTLKFELKDLAAMIDCEVVGNGHLLVLGVSSFEGATGQDITFADGSKFLNRLNQTRAGAVMVPWDFTGFDRETLACSLVRSKNPRLDFFRIVELFHPVKKPEPGISTMAAIGSDFISGKGVTVCAGATIGDNVILGDHVHIMPGVFVGDDVTIGSNTVVKPNVTIMEKTRIGQGVIIHPGTVIGSDGFGFTPGSEGHEKLVHAGFVQIDDQVEIGACNTIDRGTLGRTWIQRGVKTDNLVHIAHNVIIGENCLIVAQVGIAGSSVLGKSVIIAGKAGISGHLTIGDNAIVGPGAGVLSDVSPGEVVSGIPQMPHGLWLKVGRIIPRLPDLRKRLLALEKRVNTKENTP